MKTFACLVAFLAGLNAVVQGDEPVLTCSNTTSFITAEKRLIECLLNPKKYNPRIRPVAKYADTLDVHVALHLMVVEDINEKTGIMQTNNWLHQTWTDVQLTWDPKDFDGITHISIPAENIWKPDVVLYNTAAMNHEYVMADLANVMANGTVHWVPHARLSSFCKLELKRFPFDTQHCSLIFGSWNYDIKKVNLTTKMKPRSEFRYDGREWETMRFDVMRHEWDYNTDMTYAALQFTITVKRIPTYHRQMFVFPSVVIAFLIVFMFFVPPEASERLTLGVGLIIAITLQMTLLDQYLPTAMESTPAILVYLTFDLVMVTFAIMITIMTLNFHHRDIRKGKVPDWMRQAFLGRLSRVLCMRGEVYSSVPTNDASEPPAELRIDPEMTSTETPLPRSPTLALEKTLDEIRRYLKALSTRSVTSQQGVEIQTPHRQIVLNEWHQLALVVDRLMFWIFLVLSVLISIIVYA